MPNPSPPRAQPDRASAHVLGVDLGGTHLRLALADAAGVPVARWSTTTTGIREPHEIVALIVRGARQLLAEAALPEHALAAVGVGAPGVTDVARGVVLATSYLLGWRDVPLAALLQTALGVPARIDNDVNVATLAEASAGEARGVSDFIFLAIGTGIGSGIVLGHKLHHGADWLAGEIGYMLLPGLPDAPVPEGSPGALEGLAGGHGLRLAWQALCQTEPALPPDLTATGIFDLAVDTGNPFAADLLRRVAHALAAAIYNLTLVLNVPLIVFGGGVGTHEGLLAAIRADLALRLGANCPRLVPSALGPDAQLLGAIRLALDLLPAQ